MSCKECERKCSNDLTDSDNITQIKAQRHNSNKLDPTHIHPAMLAYLFQVGHVGGKKYAKGNYLLGGKPLSEFYASAMRHTLSAMAGEWHDPETKLPHLAHAAWNMLFACWAKESGLISEDDSLETKDMKLFKSLLDMTDR